MSSTRPQNNNPNQMDLDEPVDPLRERAASSSEPAPSRPKPFDDDGEDDQSSSRKRQRMESDDPEALPTVRASTLAMSSPIPDDVPTTPTRTLDNNSVATPNSNQVTLNLRNARDLELPSPSSPHSPPSPSKQLPAANSEPEIMDKSTESIANNIHETIETPSSPLSSEDPEIMLVEPSENDYLSDTNPTVAIIDEEIIAEYEVGDQTYSFPFLEEAESLQESALRLANFFENGTMNGPGSFNKLHLWITAYVRWARRNPNDAFTSYCENKDFWEAIIDVIKGLSYRKDRPHFGNWLKTDRAAREALSALFEAFAMLTSQFAIMDSRTLARCRDNPNMRLELASRSFLDALHFLIFGLEQEHIGQYLVNYYSWHWDSESSRMHNAFERQGASMQMFFNNAKACMDLALQAPKVLEHLREACEFVFLSLRFAGLDVNIQVRELNRRVILAYKFFELMEAHLLTFIEKHATLLGAENVMTEITSLFRILEYVMGFKDGPAENRLQEIAQSDLGLPIKFLPKTAACRWKFWMLTKLITSAQMQLRVAGTAGFCTDLVQGFHSKGQFSADEHPTLRNIANFIVSTKLVDYIVGVGSHPEIIAQSKDMVGFLAVTRTYENYHTDKIWSTVKSSQDPRVVESVLILMRGMLNLLAHRDRLYLCTKLQEMPIESFTLAMRSFCEELFRLLRHEAREQMLDLEAPPYDACVRLICESTAPRTDSPLPFNEIQQWASGQFEFLTRSDRQFTSGPDTAVRLEIYKRCLNDLRGGKTADGSLIALSLLVEANINDLRQLILEPDFIRLLIENFSWRKNPYSISVHLHMFRHIIELDLIKDSSKFGLDLWNKIIGADEVDLGGERQLGWKMLSLVMKDLKNLKKENAFIKACIQQYLPSLPPHLFSKASFSFAREAIGYLDLPEPQDGESVIDEKGVEQLWRMVLKSHDNPTFQNYAIMDLIQFYLESTTILELPNDKILEIHLAFVDRCLAQLTSAAGKLKSFSEGTMSGDDEPMIIVVQDEEIHEQESLFCRSLFLLKGFLRAYESSAIFGQTQIQPQLIIPPESVIGDPMEVSYQIFDDKTGSPVRTLKIGKLNTGISLFGSLQQVAGFKPIRVHHLGTEVTAAKYDLSKSLEELKLGTHLVLVSPKPNPSPWNERSPVQLEVMKRFDDLFELLAMEGTQTKDIYDFLVWFPAYGKLLSALASKDTSLEELFPAQHPYKSLFAMHTLHILASEQFKSQNSDQSIKLRCFSLLIEILTSHEYLDTHTNEDFKLCFFIELFESVMYYLTDSSFQEHIASSADSEVLLDRLFLLLSDCLQSSSKHSGLLVCKVFWVVIALSILSPGFWAKFKVHPATVTLVEDILLIKFDAHHNDLMLPVNSISRVCSNHTSSTPVNTAQFLQFFWPLLAGLVPKVILLPEHCEPVMSLIEAVLRVAVEASVTNGVSIDNLDTSELANGWGQLLISHEVNQFVGRPTVVDHVALGLASLLNACVRCIKTSLEPLRPMASALFNKHLFPDSVSQSDETSLLEPPLPVLDTTTRQHIVDVILALVKDDAQSYMELMKLATALVPNPTDDETYNIELTPSFDRCRVMRSSTGYVGLKNLSNTCYLNSLMTQLFMNVSFREFMLGARVTDDGIQRLLQETQNLFGRMQNSFGKFADPQKLAQSIRTYEESNIDVTVQMDVDEFYNLLFDRWEGQIPASEAKAAFRSFYGGQLVQQVKSKECDHISERLEPFSAIQCDIKGKGSLKESLQAYVDGEIMEGDNKYKCSTCDQHVDAVKRACLKDVPDNLIFHLKRFDYNLREGRRNKLNDYFSFPHDIDMRPYKVDYLTQGPEGCAEDIFELVGVLVHSGTAESGHYYSYIRERPCGNSNCWVEFNDDQVTAFDPGNIEANCFGGPTYQVSNDFQFDKNYSAYMLFYQRRSSLVEQKQKLGHLLGPEPIKLPLSRDQAISIDDENHFQVRKYVLYDPSHAYMVKQLLSTLRHVSGESCSSEHILEDQALIMTLNHMDQVFGRTKDAPDFPNFVASLNGMFKDCCACSKLFLEWIISSPEACRHYMVKCPDTAVRVGVVDLILNALRTLKNEAPLIYGIGRDRPHPVPTNSKFSVEQYEAELHELNTWNGVFGRVVETVTYYWDHVLTNLRAWPEYFSLIFHLMDGVHETALLMDNGLLRKTMNIIMANCCIDTNPEIARMLNVISRRSPNKVVHYEIVITVLEKFLGFLDSISATTDNLQFRYDAVARGWPLSVSIREFNQFSLHWVQICDNILIGDLLKLNVSETATQSILRQVLLKVDDADRGMMKQIGTAIAQGLSKDHASYPPNSFLKGALTFCRNIEDHRLFREMAVAVKKHALDSEVYGGLHYLQFFKDLMDLPDNRTGMSQQDLQQWCLKFIIEWAPALLVNYDANCRAATEDYLSQVLFRYKDGVIDEEDSAHADFCRRVAIALGDKCLEYLEVYFIRQNTQITKAQLHSIKVILDTCKHYYESGSEDQIRFIAFQQSILNGMQRLAVTHLDDEGSAGSDEWDGSDGELSTSSLLAEDQDPVSLVGGNIADQ